MTIIKILLLLLCGINSFLLLNKDLCNRYKINAKSDRLWGGLYGINMLALEDNKNNKNGSYEFPTFSKFIEEKNKRDEEIIKKYLKKAEEKDRINRLKLEDINIKSKDIKLLNNLAIIEWTKQWIHDMVNSGTSRLYPKFMYEDMFIIREFAARNITNKYFYIGYFPGDIITNRGPYYIAALELITKNKVLDTQLIVQNPNYIIKNEIDNYRMVNFKKELKMLCGEAGIFFRYGNLRNKSDNRYYMCWLLEDE